MLVRVGNARNTNTCKLVNTLLSKLLLIVNKRKKPQMSATLEYYFTTEPDDELKCLICLGVARDPVQHEECGKLFCKMCLEKYGKDKPCPNCRQEKSQYYVDKRGKQLFYCNS